MVGKLDASTPAMGPCDLDLFLVVRAKRRVAGWVAGGCWDSYG